MNQKRYLWLRVALLALAAVTSQTVHADPPKGTPPEGWQDVAIGEAPGGGTEVKGSGAEAVWTITGTGADIWGSADQFQFAYTQLPGDGGITARLLTQTGGHNDGWARTGTMLREGTEPGARFAMLIYSNGNALQASWRVEPENTPTDDGLGSRGRTLEGGPIWLRTQRKGQVYQHLISDDGKSWQSLGQKALPIEAGKAILAGLCATMHGGETPVTATFDNVSVSADIILPTPAGPSLVQAYPGAGAVLLTYSTVQNAVGYHIYRQGPDEKEPVKLTAEPTANAWYTDDKGLTNGASYRYTVRAVFKDAEGAVTESAPSLVVLAEPQVPITPGFYSHDIGTQTPGATSLADGVLTVTGSGADIGGGVTDGFRYVAMPLVGDYSMSAKLLEKPAGGEGNSDPWIKAGLMIRESLDPGARFGIVLATTGNGVQFQWRRTYRQADSDSLGMLPGTDDATTTYPLFLRIARTANRITAYQSPDGTSYELIGDAITFPNLSPTTYGGFAVTAHAEGKSATAKFDAASLKIE